MLGEKRGETSTISVVIAIVLGIAVLVFLIYGFTVGWGNFWSRITAFTGGSANVDTIKQACDIACSQQGLSQFCGLRRDVNTGDGKKISGTCYQLGEYQKGLGFVSCNGINTNDCYAASSAVTYDDGSGKLSCKPTGVSCTTLSPDVCITNALCGLDTTTTPQTCKLRDATKTCTALVQADCETSKTICAWK